MDRLRKTTSRLLINQRTGHIYNEAPLSYSDYCHNSPKQTTVCEGITLTKVYNSEAFLHLFLSMYFNDSLISVLNDPKIR